MWPPDLYSVSGATGLEPLSGLAMSGLGLESVRALGQFERAGLQFAATLALAVVVLGLLQGYGPRTVSKVRRSPIISLCIGLPALLVVGGFTSTGYLIHGTELGVFFGIPMVIIGGTVAAVLTVLGVVAIGRSITARLGRDRLPAGVLVGSVLVGVAGLSPIATAAVVALAGALGIGAGVRVIMGAGGTTQPDDRTVPPANKI